MENLNDCIESRFPGVLDTIRVADDLRGLIAVLIERNVTARFPVHSALKQRLVSGDSDLRGILGLLYEKVTRKYPE